MKPERQNIVLGAGYVFFAEEDEDGNPKGERYLGDTPGFSITANTENLQVYSSDGPVAELLDDITTQVSRESTVTVQNVDIDNLAAFLLGDVVKRSQESDTVTDERFEDVKVGRWYQLGETDDDFRGARDVSDVTVKRNPDNGSEELTEGEDYYLDKELGRLYLMPDGGVSDGDEIAVDYSKAEATWDGVETHQLGPQTGKLRFVAHNTTGTNRDLLIPRCQMAPTGDLPFKSRDTQIQLEFNLRVGSRSGQAQMYLDGRPV